MPVPNVRFIRTDSDSNAFKTSQKRKVFFAGYFTRGTPNKFTSVYSPLDFKIKFGKPDDINRDEWFQIYNYFEYDNKEIVISRVIGEDSYNASASYPFNDFNLRIDTLDEFRLKKIKSDYNFIRVIARSPGSWANDLTVSIFTYKELKNNLHIFAGKNAKDLIHFLSFTEYCLCVFHKETLVEQFTFEKSVEFVNEKSKYIFISFEPNAYRFYDGNTALVDGNSELADGNEEVIRPQVFFGDNSLKLEGGSETLPSDMQIYDTYMELGESDDYIFDFILANNKFPTAAIELADKRGDCCALIGIPRGEDPLKYVKKLPASPNAIVYHGYKLMRDIFTDKTIFVNCIGDVLGIRTYLINNHELSASHCKILHTFKNYLDLADYLNMDKIGEYYNSNINVVKKGYTGAYSLSENMLNAEKLTNRIIYYNLLRECEEVVRHFIFEQNDEFTRNDLLSKLKNVCRAYVADNNIEDFKVVCDRSNNPNQDHNIFADVYYKPKFLVEEIVIRLQSVSVI